jgi:tRNA nucleotidyltransferase (CCA-adding enzyme)
MKIYQVGGAVRDKLLGRPVTDRDWVVVGATPEDMLACGFRAVGASFPVFLHPETSEEYALARTERKTGQGYKGFAVDCSPEVTLEQDLMRRDLTINAMAEDAQGTLIDPFGGRRDLEQGLLRHVSPAFTEDPLRVLRVARFAAQLGFEVAPETLALMRDMSASGELDALVPERVWLELSRALTEPEPDRFVSVLRECGALAALFPSIDCLFGVPQPAKHHPEIDTGLHILMVLREAARRKAPAAVCFAVLVHDLGKGTTPPQEWPSHRGHEQRSAELIRELCARYRVPNEFRDLALMVALHHGHCHRALELKPATKLRLFEDLDAFRRPERFEEFLTACEIDFYGRGGPEHRDYPQARHLREARTRAAAISVADLVGKSMGGEQLAARLHERRVAAIRG